MKKVLFLLCGAMVIAFVSLWLTACEQEKNEVTGSDATIVDDRSGGDSKVFPPNAHPYGKSYAEWSVSWLQVFMGFTCDENPWLNAGNPLFYQTGPVYFLAGLSEAGASVDITVPQGKAILFPLTNYINDYPCPDPTFEPAEGQSLVDFLTEGMAGWVSGVSGLSVEVDGGSLSNPESYLFTTDLFEFTGDISLANDCNFDACVTGAPQNAVGRGYYIMLKPLSIGTHTVHYHSVTWGDFVQDGTFNITVQ